MQIRAVLFGYRWVRYNNRSRSFERLMVLPAGTRLGPYEIQSALGAGGMGEVYKARDTRLDRIVAIKVLTESLAADPQFRERFDREARTISQLHHPHICALYDVGEQDSTAYLVMEYLEGETLAHRLEKSVLSLDQALRYAIEIAAALEAAHRAGIVHRDLKPGNVILTAVGRKTARLRAREGDDARWGRRRSVDATDDASGADSSGDAPRHLSIHGPGAA